MRTVISPLGQILTTEEVADILKTSQRTVQRLIRQGQLKAHKVGRGYRVRDQDLIDFFQSHPTAEPLQSGS
jgi:excisionase family DNA binding protein